MDEPLASEPRSSPSDLAGVLATIRSHVDYLGAEIDVADADRWIASERLLDDGPALLDLIEAFGRERHTDEPDVAASLFSLSYAFRIASIPVAALALGLPGPDIRPVVTAVTRPGRGASTVGLRSPVLAIADPPALTAALLGDHLARFHVAVRRQVSIGERLLWGNAASSIARVFRAIEGAPGVDRATVRTLAADFFAVASPWLDGQGTFDVVTAGAVDGWYWTRSSCCLWTRAAGAFRCDDCSLFDPAELEATRRAELEPPPA